MDGVDAEMTPRRRSGRPRMLTAADSDALMQLVREYPLLSLEDVAAAFRRRRSISISPPTVRKYLLAAGWHFQRHQGNPLLRSVPEQQTGPGAAEAVHKTYGYTEAHRDPGDLVRYPCGLTDSEWEQVKHLFDRPGRPGKPETYPRRQMLDACIYVLRSGCSWRMLPKDFPKWTAVYKTFRRWLAKDLFEQMYDELRKLWRERQHRASDPTATVLDSQSVKTSPQGGPHGYDAAKKVKGRKRHLVTDTLGLLIAVLITVGSVQDRDAAQPAMDLALTKVPGIKLLYVDGGYAGKCAQELQNQYQIEVEVVRHPQNRKIGRWQEEQLSFFERVKGFAVLPKRWVIERTNAWTERPRRMNRDHDRNLAVSTAWVWLTEGRMLLRRITSDPLAQT